MGHDFREKARVTTEEYKNNYDKIVWKKKESTSQDEDNNESTKVESTKTGE